MKCKFCKALLPEDVTLCPACGQDNADALSEEMAREITEEELAEAAMAAAEEETGEATEETTEETTEEVPEEAKPVKKTGLWVKILAIVGAVALAAVLIGAVLYGIGAFEKKADSYTVSDSKAVKASDTVVATVGDVELTNSELQIYYWQAVSEFYNYYGYYLDAATLDMTKPLDEQFYNEETGVTWQQYFLESGLSTWSRYAALVMQAREDGYELDADAQAYLDSIPAQLEEMAASYGYETVADMLAEDMSPACNEAGYLQFVSSNFYAGQYMDSRYDALIPTAEEIEAYYKENEAALNEEGIVNDGSITTDVRHILICPQGGTEDDLGNVTYSDAEWETCRVTAQQILDQWQAQGATEDIFAQLAMEYSEDPGSQTAGGLYTDVYEGEMVPEFNDWCFDASRAYGDTGLVKTTYGYHVMYFVGSEEVWIANVRDTLINDRSMAIVDGAAAKWPMEVNYKKIVLGQISETEAE